MRGSSVSFKTGSLLCYPRRTRILMPSEPAPWDGPAAASRSMGHPHTRDEEARQPSAAVDGRQAESGGRGLARARYGASDAQERSACEHAPLLLFDEGTLLEVLVRLDVADLANTACTCKAFAVMCRSECLWRQLSALRGIRILECDAPGSGWRQIYVALCKVEVVAWSPLSLAELKRICQLFTAIRVHPRHTLVCAELQLEESQGPGLPYTLSHGSSAPGPDSTSFGVGAPHQTYPGFPWMCVCV